MGRKKYVRISENMKVCQTREKGVKWKSSESRNIWLSAIKAQKCKLRRTVWQDCCHLHFLKTSVHWSLHTALLPASRHLSRVIYLILRCAFGFASSLLVCLASFRAHTSCPNLTSKAFGSVWHPRQVSAGQPWRLEIKDSSSRFFEDAVCTGSTWGRESVIDLLYKKWSISNCRHSLEEDPHWAPLVSWTLHTNRSGEESVYLMSHEGSCGIETMKKDKSTMTISLEFYVRTCELWAHLQYYLYTLVVVRCAGRYWMVNHGDMVCLGMRWSLYPIRLKKVTNCYYWFLCWLGKQFELCSRRDLRTRSRLSSFWVKGMRQSALEK